MRPLFLVIAILIVIIIAVSFLKEKLIPAEKEEVKTESEYAKETVDKMLKKDVKDDEEE